ncbi:MAG: four helix bundle suffix domain-containing protein [Candidatus Shapirobacteria bacterium]
MTKRSIGTPRNDRGGLAREGGPARRSFSEGGYRSLPFFQQAEIIHDFTVEFCEKYIDKCFSGPYKNYNRHKSYKNFSRQSDQLIQAARSGKQNIAEGYLQKSSALKLNLLAVARASLEELLNDYQDFLRQKKLKIWAKDDPSAKAVRALVYKRYKNYNDYKKYQSSGETAANTMICLINQTNQLLDQKLRWLEEDFVKNGGFRENLLKKRLNYRREAGTASLALLVLFFLLAAIKIIIVITVISFIAARGNRACLAAGQSFSLSLSPPLLEVVLQPGKSITQAYEVKNLGTSLLYLQTEIRFFLPSEALAKEGQITYQEPDIFTGLPEFKLNNANINLGDTFVLEPNQSQQLVLKITAPLDLPQKDYYATFFIQQIPEVSFSEQQAQPGLAGQIGSNILITVSQTADLEAKGEISEFFSQPKLADLGQEIKFTIKAANLGENFFKSAGKIEIYNIFGKKIK